MKMTQRSLLKRAKTAVKKALRTARLRYVKRFRRYDPTALEAMLRTLGLATGDTVFVHSSMGAFEGFTGKASDIIAAIEAIIGSHGTLLMPSIPFDSTALAYVQSGKVTDVMRTPSRNGLLTETFRRQKGTLRSLHPTHPVLARGDKAVDMIAKHQFATTPCGENSPFAHLLAEDGKILFLGVSIETMTFFHYLEEKHEPLISPSPFTAEIFEAKVKSGDKLVSVRMRLFDPNQSRRRTILPMLAELRRQGGSRESKLGGVPLVLVEAQAASDVFKRVMERGDTFYG